MVEAMAGCGIPETDIATVVGIAAKTLRKHFRTELDTGHIKANAKLPATSTHALSKASSMVSKASGP